MSSLKELQEGKLKGIKRLQLSENLTSFPTEIFDLADSLEILDLSNNQLSTLPKEMFRFKKLKIAFFSNNNFKVLPNVFKECSELYMLGFKANKIEVFEEDILPLSIRWLILTDNKLKTLPNSIGKLTELQKFPLAGNELSSLPQTMQACSNVELIRLSANNLKEIPLWLLELPKLSWLAFSGNPCSHAKPREFKEIEYKRLQISTLLGEGASGMIYKAYSPELDSDVALKLFKGAITSDGYAVDEMHAYLGVDEHPNLIKVLAKVQDEDKLGVVLEYIPNNFINLGNPPNFDTCTRDTYKNNDSFSIQAIKKVAKSIASVAAHLHQSSLMHGDLYAHNILVNEKYQTYLGDFGAASFYNKKDDKFEKIEVRAFGCLLDDMLHLCEQESESLKALRDRCISEDIQSRPLFCDMKF